MTHRIIFTFIAISILSFLACDLYDNDSHSTTDNVWVTEFEVRNESQSTIIVTTFGWCSRAYPDTIQPFTDGTLTRCGDFAPHQPSTAYTCISMALLTGTIVYQMLPVIDESWQSIKIDKYIFGYFLTINDDSLHLEGLEDQCEDTI